MAYNNLEELKKMRRGLTDIVFGHIEKNSFALYNSCVKKRVFRPKKVQ